MLFRSSNGGTTSTISVYQWDHSCVRAGVPSASCSDTNLVLLETSTNASCRTATGDAFCGIVNNAPQMIMLTGRLYDEGTMARVALAFEQATEWKDRHPKLNA